MTTGISHRAGFTHTPTVSLRKARIHPTTHLVSGFTLIELLVVIAIIGVLSSVVLASLSSARARANDAARKADMKTLQTALELYYQDNNSYPVTGLVMYSSETGDAVGNNSGNWIPGLAPKYISALPRDPRGGASLIQPTCGPWKSAFLYYGDATGYKILSHCAPQGGFSTTDAFYEPLRPTWAWMVCVGQTECGI